MSYRPQRQLHKHPQGAKRSSSPLTRLVWTPPTLPPATQDCKQSIVDFSSSTVVITHHPSDVPPKGSV